MDHPNHNHNGARRRCRRPRLLTTAAILATALLTAFVLTAAGGAATSGTAAAAPSSVTAPVISGSPVEGQTLSVTSGSWAGDTPITYAYQWKACDSSGASCSDLVGETGQTHIVAAAELGKTIRVLVTATNDAGSSTALSEATAVVVTAAAKPVNTVPPVITGTLQPGSTLTASNGTWTSATPLAYSYSWQRCDAEGNNCTWVVNTPQTYLLQSADLAHTFRVYVAAANAGGSQVATSGLTGVVGGAAAITNTVTPVISGTPVVGQTLTVSNGGWTGSPTTFTYAWQRCDSNGNNCVWVGGANKQTYVLGNDDVNHRLGAQVTASGSAGTSSKASDLTTVVAAGQTRPVNTQAPVISGAAQLGVRLTTSNGTWTGTPPISSYSYDWWRCDPTGNNCKVISGQTGSSYTLVAPDLGQTIRSRVTATNSAGSTSAESNQTGLVTGTVTPVTGTVRANAVTLPDRLVISGVSFAPARLTTRAAFTASFRVTDSNGQPVSGALVYAVALPYGWIGNAPEVQTGADGWARIPMQPTFRLPLKRSAVVMFVRARKPGGSLLAGVSTRRLVQVLTG